ncbi:von Willebrand factor A domain-containing protein 5A [Folsomia candida]|uniref:von Willebrand factor A domain-containing protein 5A n=1 Tax=Folsomia candida TaxID=158441 RepID=A0A226E2E4_FOLCA|nr:von Willebrand factor A domain-containing protein 5A [Folsomia candida]
MSENWENSVIHVKNKYLLPSAKLDDQKYEFVFVLDRSGSMGGTSIELARQACVQEFGTARISTIAKVVSDNETRGRVFTLGIGRQASVELVNRVAEAGNGTSEFVLGDDRIQTKVLNQLKHALRSPLLKAVRIENRERILG